MRDTCRSPIFICQEEPLDKTDPEKESQRGKVIVTHFVLVHGSQAHQAQINSFNEQLLSTYLC